VANKLSADLRSLAEEVRHFEYKRDDEKLDLAQRRAKGMLRVAFGENAPHIADLEKIHYTPSIAFSGMSESAWRDPWVRGRDRLANLLDAAAEELAMRAPSAAERSPSDEGVGRVFVVHGHDSTLLENVARTLSRLGVEPVILKEQTNSGHTIIEKLERYGDVGFAVVLLTPDDKLTLSTENGEKQVTRARQNVVLELGYFMGRLGRGRVVAVHVRHAAFEIPSDYSGVAWIAADDGGAWRYSLGKELRAAGIAVDLNHL